VCLAPQLLSLTLAELSSFFPPSAQIARLCASTVNRLEICQLQNKGELLKINANDKIKFKLHCNKISTLKHLFFRDGQNSRFLRAIMSTLIDHFRKIVGFSRF